MKKFTLKELIFMAICSDLGIALKKVISPFSNMITDSLHIPGGISTSFSISIIVVCAVLINKFGAGIIMSIIQCFTAFLIGSVGSMGAFSFVAYFFPGLVIDLVIFISNNFKFTNTFKIFISLILASITSSVVANFIVFGLRGIPYILYLFVSALSGAICSIFSDLLFDRVSNISFFK